MDIESKAPVGSVAPGENGAVYCAGERMAPAAGNLKGKRGLTF
jgi:hypothetical protein